MNKKTKKKRRNLKNIISCLIIIAMTTTSVSSSGTWQEYEGVGGTYDASHGLPDFDQRQDADWYYVPPGNNTTLSMFYCGPTSATNAIWYLDCLHDINGQTNHDLIEEAHSPSIVHDLIEDIADYTILNLGFRYTPSIYMKIGLDNFFDARGLSEKL